MTAPDGTAVRLEQAERKIRSLSIWIALLIGMVGGLVSGIVARVLDAPMAGAVGAGGGAFIAVSTLALVVEARINKN
ncbi:hypothetical protein [Streptomyces phaeochromogenes]|uniref:hypothetical protein n=1 Tax=Streptomyces phaeochromogenes TaxID=1923 RepID=UPI002DDB6B35|nr:hypothetical protein [Streptomyces phaeochromogenes]WRZ29979.1 hypothetical protein OG931_20615 [Streptomyces phaeochromogenes]